MKKSEIYFKAQVAMLNSTYCGIDKLEVLRELMRAEDLAMLLEKQEEQEKADETV